MGVSNDSHWASLTNEQCLAAVSQRARRFIEAFPGSGKTTVASQRFGFLRYGSLSERDARTDGRAVVAASFTRAATWELQSRIRRHWGPRATAWPHRVVTLDTLIYAAVAHLLETNLIQWPSGHTQLEVHDSWQVITPNVFTRGVNSLDVLDSTVVIRHSFASQKKNSAPPEAFRSLINRGICTHDDIRTVLAGALVQPSIAEAVRHRFGATIRALIVDEVFDANALDLQVIKLAADAGVDITMVGDPWQALYGFRGARPDLVEEFIRTGDVHSYSLSTSFRWQTSEQLEIATALRAGEGVELARGALSHSRLDVVLASQWKDLWECSPQILPLAFQSPKGNTVEAASTLLLNALTVARFDTPAVFIADALATLGITRMADPRRMEEELARVLRLLADATTPPLLEQSYNALIEAVERESLREFPRYHWSYGKRLRSLGNRLLATCRLIPGMTIHQAKGREWDVVGVRLTDSELSQFAQGLRSDDADHRKLYVAATRARLLTTAV
ncbi:UvrD-helicase domain-containing protein [Arthrobacter sp. GCM10027362]|uniref:UvrD-helicase domain-containing protein n=1 Tax=Arthrobacter sp. GCM10027362 TaxID=3273379 RepID=UPI0036444268